MSVSYIDMNVGINSWFNAMDEKATTATTGAVSILNSLKDFTGTTLSSNTNFVSVTTPTDLTMPDKPAMPSINTGITNLPSSIDLIAPLVLDVEVPEFNVVDVDVTLPNIPAALAIQPPTKDFSVTTEFDFPVTPSDALPDVPTLSALNIPIVNVDTLQPITASAPVASDIVIYDPGFSFSSATYQDALSEETYVSALWTALREKLTFQLDNATGIDPVVEEAIWARGRDRENRALLQAERTLLTERSQAGFSRPQGALMAALDKVVQESQSKSIEISREIMMKQADLEQSNFKETIKNVMTLEQSLATEHNAIIVRRLEIAKYAVELGNQIKQLQISKFNAEVESYKALASVFSVNVQNNLSRLEKTKTEIEAERLRGANDEQKVKQYLAQIDGIKAKADLFKTAIEAVNAKLAAESSKIAMYKAEVDAYGTLVKAKADEYGMYAEGVKGELAKTGLYDSRVKAFASRIDAYASQANVAIKKAEIESEIEKLKVDKYKADLDAYVAKIQSDQSAYQNAVALFKGQADMYSAEASVNKSVADIAVKAAENAIMQNKYIADVGIKNAEITLSGMQASYNASLEAKKAAGSIYAQLAASALSGINVSAGAHVSFGNSASNSYSESRSLN